MLTLLRATTIALIQMQSLYLIKTQRIMLTQLTVIALSMYTSQVGVHMEAERRYLCTYAYGWMCSLMRVPLCFVFIGGRRRELNDGSSDVCQCFSDEP